MFSAGRKNRKRVILVFVLGLTGMALSSCGGEEQGSGEGDGNSAGGSDSTMSSGTGGTMMEDSTMEETGTAAGEVEGLVSVRSEYDAAETVERLTQNVEEGGNMVVATVDHASAAQGIGEELRPTTLLVFGNPEAGTGLMQVAQTTGIDLPQKALVWEDAGGQVWLSYNDPQYLAERHGITGMDEMLGMISTNLQNLAESTTGGEVSGAMMEDSMMESSMIESSGMESSMMMEESTMMGEMSEVTGLVTTRSDAGFDETVTNIEATVEEQDFTIVANVDHSANAATVDEELRPTTVIIFGKPTGGTPFMQASQTAGIDLPQKMLVWESESGAVNISYNDPQYLAERHALTGVEAQVEMVSDALESIAAAGAGGMMESSMMEETTS